MNRAFTRSKVDQRVEVRRGRAARGQGGRGLGTERGGGGLGAATHEGHARTCATVSNSTALHTWHSNASSTSTGFRGSSPNTKESAGLSAAAEGARQPHSRASRPSRQQPKAAEATRALGRRVSCPPRRLNAPVDDMDMFGGWRAGWGALGAPWGPGAWGWRREGEVVATEKVGLLVGDVIST
jgi:hypothetical protein